MDYPIQQQVISERLIEQAVARHYLSSRRIEHTDVFSGDDSKGIPDVFAFNDRTLIACIEVGAYVLGAIQDNQAAMWIDGHLLIDIGKSSAVHDSQPEPYTIVQKKLIGGRRYARFDGADLILVIHSDVRWSGEKLMFALDGPLQMSPSCNHFSHFRDEIVERLIKIAVENAPLQWDEVVLIDYTVSIDPAESPIHRIYQKRAG